MTATDTIAVNGAGFLNDGDVVKVVAASAAREAASVGAK